MPNTIKTRFLVLSDTHGATPEDLKIADLPEVDVAVHCGDLTQDSRIDEYHTALHLLNSVKAPLKLFIAGNHDRTLDPSIYQGKPAATTATSPTAALSFTEIYGSHNEAVSLFDTPESRATGIVYLKATSWNSGSRHAVWGFGV